MDAAFVADWLNLYLRWAHMIVGIAWVGASFYFIWLDNTCTANRPGGRRRKASVARSGRSMAAASTPPRNSLLAPREASARAALVQVGSLHHLLITGFFLLVPVLLLRRRDRYLIDPLSSPLSKPEAIAIGARSSWSLGWLVYDGLCRSALGEDDLLLGGLLFLYCAVAAWALCQLFSGRGAFLHFGAMLGTIMVLNVLLRDHPGPDGAGEAPRRKAATPDPKHGVRGGSARCTTPISPCPCCSP